MDVTVAPTGTGDAFEHTANCEGLAVDRARGIGHDQYDGIADLDLHAARQQRWNQHLAGFKQRAGLVFAYFTFVDALAQRWHGGIFGGRIDAVQTDAGVLGEIAEHRTEFDAKRICRDIRICLQGCLDLFDGFGLQTQIERQVVDRLGIAFAVNLQMAEHAVGDRANHGLLERTGGRHKEQQCHHAESDQQRGEQGTAAVTQQIARREFECGDHAATPSCCRRPSSSIKVSSASFMIFGS